MEFHKKKTYRINHKIRRKPLGNFSFMMIRNFIDFFFMLFNLYISSSHSILLHINGKIKFKIDFFNLANLFFFAEKFFFLLYLSFFQSDTFKILIRFNF